MTHVPHELPEEFPAHVGVIQVLKQGDAHFQRLAAEYAEVNHQIHLAECNLKAMDDLTAIDLRKQRGQLRDRIWTLLREAQPA